MSQTKQIPHNIHLSTKQNELLPVLQAASGLNKSELVRAALALIAAQYHIDFPQDGQPGGVPKRGTHNR